MQAILTKIIPATNTKPTRIKAVCARGSLTVARDTDLDYEQDHKQAAKALAVKFSALDTDAGIPLDGSPWLRPTVCGQLPDGSFAHVYA